MLVGGIGIEADGRYSFDRDIDDVDANDEELTAVAGANGFAAPAAIRADRITADGRALRYVDSEATRTDPATAPDPGALEGAFVAVDGYVDATVHAGIPYGGAGSGVRPDDASFASAGGWIVTDAADANRFPPRAASAGGGDLGSGEVRTLMSQALAIAQRARGQIRQPARLDRAGFHRGGGPRGRSPRRGANRGRAALRHRRRGAEGAHRDVLLAAPARRTR